RHLQPVPAGVPGELFISGDGLARGYLGSSSLTAERFLPNPFSSASGARMYRTGDLARHRHDGVLEFLGRIDNQVKVRGFRIELAEVESALLSHASVREAVVVAREDSPGLKRLVAYVTGEAQALGTEALRAFLKQRLPEYMVPSAFVHLEALPLTSHGKVDRKALPAPDSRPELAQAFVAPRNDVEQKLASIWAEVLRLERVGIHDNFFELGGHSLLATRAISRIRGTFSVELPLRDLFDAPTVATLGARLQVALQRQQGPKAPPMVPVPRTGRLPLSFAQQRLWFLDQLEPNNAAYNMPTAVRLDGALDLAALERSFNELVRRHESLRTTFRNGPEGATQVIAPAVQQPLPVVELTGLPEGARDAEARRLAIQEAQRPFDLARGPLLRTLLLRLGEHQHVLLVTMHHIVSDGWSMALLIREMGLLYEAFSTGRPSPLPELALQYADYSAWQQGWLQGEALDAQLTYWREHLAGAPQVLELPTDHPRPATQSHRGATRSALLPLPLTEGLQELARAEGVTPFMLVLTAFQVLLHRYSGQEDLVVGTDVANRHHAEIEGLIGFFVNQLALRSRISGDPTFRELLGRTRDSVLGGQAHQDLPFEELVRALNPERSLRHAPLFQVKLTYQTTPQGGAMELPGLTLRGLGTEEESTVAKIDLTLVVSESSRGLSCVCEYATDLFEASSIDRLLASLRVLLAGAVADAGQRVSTMPLLSEEERHKLLVEWNATDASLPPEARAQELFEAQAERTPDAVALSFEDSQLTYRELNRRANQLAHHLRTLGVGQESRVGLCVERSLELVVGALGVLKAGGAFVPLDPSYPQERLAFMMRDAALSLVLTQERLADELPSQGELLICLDSEWARIALCPEDTPRTEAGEDPLAYVIYTSGSTGQPKGTLLAHRGLCNTALAAARVQRLGPDSRVLQFAASGFDASIWEMFSALLSGAHLCLAPRDSLMPGAPLQALIQTRGITAATLTPSVLAQLEPDAVPGLRTVTSAGEACTPELARRWKPGRRFLNAYGPTEVTVCATVCEDVDEARPGIGRPLPNVQVYVLDARLQPVPIGVPGELYVGGVGLARGYLNRPELTAERFVSNPFRARDGARLYRTGDLVRYRADGQLEYLGRIDNQVKVRGFRIELGEIEAVLEQHPTVRQAAVVAREDVPGDKRLVAYVVGRDGQHSDAGELRAWVARTLPQYMVPSALVELEALPLTPNGKVDRKALPSPEGVRPDTGPAFVAPRDEVEQQLAAMWSELLGVERVGVHDNFFDLGGHSLLATQLVSRVRSTCGVELPLRDLFDAPTIAALAPRVHAALQTRQGVQAPALVPVPRTGRLPLSFAQQRLWFLDQLDPNNAAYNLPTALRLEGMLDLAALERSFNELIRRHESLRTTFRGDPEGATQVISPAEHRPLPVMELSGLPEGEREAEAWRLAVQETQLPFDLARGPLVRTLLLRLGERQHVLLVTMHHIISDGWSMAQLTREMGLLYAAFSSGKPSPLPELAVQYADYAAWQQGWLQGEVLEAQLSWWREHLAGAAQVLELPTDRPRPAVRSHRGATRSVMLPASLSDRVRELARAEGVTPFMLLLAAFQVLLQRYSGQDDFVVGTDVANRHHAELESLIGFFVNQLALRANLGGDPTFRELLGRTRDSVLGGQAHQDLPFEELVRALNPERSLRHAPLFQVKLMYQTTPHGGGMELPGLTLRALETAQEAAVAKLDITLVIGQTPRGLSCVCEYATDLFDADTIGRMLEHFHVLLEALTTEPGRRLSSLPLLTQAERHQLLVEWNATRADFPRDVRAQHLFEAQARRTPDAIAVRMGEVSLTYRQLDTRANQLAWHLRSLGVGPDVRVGLCVERSPELVVAILGVLKAGGAYVPLDPSYPSERLAFMLRDARIPVLLTQEHLADELPVQSELLVLLDAEWDTLIAAQPEHAPDVPVLAENLAYVIYTSGSTGRPKGVMLEHLGLVNYLSWCAGAYGMAEGTGAPTHSPLAFDLTVTSLLLPLTTGHPVTLVPESDGVEGLGAALRSGSDFSLVKLTPTHLSLLSQQLSSEQAAGRTRAFVIGGEALSYEALSFWRTHAPATRLLNEYGPTETVVGCCVHEVSAAEASSGAVPIGRPIANVELHVLDSALRLVPVGVPGELYIGGVPLARG
ncbi:MAG: amino acid adenylation domain-containing protein, partial [Hyalangium sp.]|uniref:amino acid adenylation domain-containing protein n=1 Tax=Hyalangium sp. TaxID=2028555 RepID=UPI00389AF711